MSYVHRHPETGVYQFRRAVPAPLRPLLGRREYVRSLGTTDHREAKRLAADIARQVQREMDAAAARLAGAVPVAPMSGEPPPSATAMPSRPLALLEARAIACAYRDQGVEAQLSAVTPRLMPRGPGAGWRRQWSSTPRPGTPSGPGSVKATSRR